MNDCSKTRETGDEIRVEDKGQKMLPDLADWKTLEQFQQGMTWSDLC